MKNWHKFKTYNIVYKIVDFLLIDILTSFFQNESTKDKIYIAMLPYMENNSILPEITYFEHKNHI